MPQAGNPEQRNKLRSKQIRIASQIKSVPNQCFDEWRKFCSSAIGWLSLKFEYGENQIGDAKIAE